MTTTADVVAAIRAAGLTHVTDDPTDAQSWLTSSVQTWPDSDPGQQRPATFTRPKTGYVVVTDVPGLVEGNRAVCGGRGYGTGTIRVRCVAGTRPAVSAMCRTVSGLDGQLIGGHRVRVSAWGDLIEDTSARTWRWTGTLSVEWDEG